MDYSQEFPEPISALDAARKYDSLLHSLTHEDTKSDFDRHVLLFDNWSRDYDDG